MTTTLTDRAALRARDCKPTRTGLDQAAIDALLQVLPDWRQDGAHITRSFEFENYYRTLAFVNAIAWTVHAQDHHPELTVTYNRCVVRYDTHTVNDGKGGISINDFICAAKIDAIFAPAMTAVGA